MKNINTIAESGELLDGRYKLLKPLSSEGGTADVWLALDKNTIDEMYDLESDSVKADEDSGLRVAIKIYRPKNALDLGEQRFREEFKIVFNCHHTNLVQPINFSIYEGIPYLVLPYCSKGSSETLSGKIRDKEQLWKYISDVSAGLAYLHSFKPTIVHHDIKPANVLIDDNDNFAITDFGISSQRGLNREGYDENHSGTMAYMAPERFNDDYESIPESDIWSFGATLYELVTGKVPFGEDGGLTQLKKECKLPSIQNHVPKDIKTLIYDCLSLEPSKRPSAKKIHECAKEHRYPPKNEKNIVILSTVLLVLIVALVFIFIKNDNKKNSPVISQQDHFNIAKNLLASSSSVDLTKALAILDTLEAEKFVPAIYEKAVIYGWYSDSVSLARKNLLGINYYPENTIRGDYDLSFLPVDDQINRKAISLFSNIVEINDSSYAEYNAKACYMLATYYCNTDEVVANDRSRALSLCEDGLFWATLSGDTILVNNIQSAIDELNNALIK